MKLRDFLTGNAPWLAAGALLTFLSSFGQTFFISIFAGEIRADFGLSHGQWGGIYTLGTALSALAVIWAGGLTDRHRVRVLGPLVLAGLAAACLAMAVNPFAWSLVLVILALRFFGQGMSSHIAQVAMARWFERSRGRALAVATLGFALGEALLPLTFVALKAAVDWRLLWVAAGSVALLAIPVLLRLLREERTPQSHAERAVSAGMDGRHWTRRAALAHPLFWFLVPALLGPSAFGTALFFHQVHLAGLKGWDHIEMVRLFPFYTATAVAVAMLSGWAIDRLGSVRLLPYFLLPAAAAFAVLGLAASPAQFLIGLCLYAATTGTLATLLNAFWAEVYGTAHIGAIKAGAAAVMVLGSALGPGLTGMLIDAGVGLEAQFLAVCGYFLAATALMGVGIAQARRRL